MLGGNFNLDVSRRHASEERVTSAADQKIQQRLRDEFRLLNCRQHQHPDAPLAPTLRYARFPDVTYHCDGLFVPEGWSSLLQSCDVIRGEDWTAMSDHNPVMAMFGWSEA